jgi:hypothetical protein
MKKPIFEVEGLDDTNRGEFRLRPSEHDIIKLYIAGKEVEVDNISANGIAFKFSGNVKIATYKVVLELELDGTYKIECAIKILRQEPPIHSGVLVDLTPKETRIIGEFITKGQKRAIRQGGY